MGHIPFEIWIFLQATKLQLPRHFWPTVHGLHTPGMNYNHMVCGSFNKLLYKLYLKNGFLVVDSKANIQ